MPSSCWLRLMSLFLILLGGARLSFAGELPAYRIDFKIDPPVIERKTDQYALVTGKVLNNADASPSELSYTIELKIEGGPAQQSSFSLPPNAARGLSRFANNLEPQIGIDGGTSALMLRVLGKIGQGNDREGRGLEFYRDPSSSMLVRLRIGEGDRYILHNLRYTLTGIDAVLGGDCPLANKPEPNNPVCGSSFIDRVIVYSSGGRNAYTLVDPLQTGVIADTLTAQVTDTDNSGRPDYSEDRRVTAESARGNVTVFHPTELGSQLEFRFLDAGKGIDGDPDGLHDFDAPEQAIGLASGITFDLIKKPNLISSVSDPKLASIQGLIFADANANGVQDKGEQGIEGVVIAVYEPDGITEALNKTFSNSKGQYQLKNLQPNQTYRLEAQVKLPALVEEGNLTPLRLIRNLTPTAASLSQLDFAVWPFELKSLARSDALLLPDLQPLLSYPVPAYLPEAARQDILRSYPGMEQWYVDTQTRPGRVFIRFGTLALNLGQGPLHVLGTGSVDKHEVYQRIYTRTGAYIQQKVGSLEQHPSHDHVHIAAFERYSVRDFKTKTVLASADKVSFCLTDVLWSIRPELTQTAPIATVPLGWSCGAYEQSINVGFSDYYGPAIPDQLIDVTDLPDGSYWLTVEVNPTKKLRESNFENNMVDLKIDFDNPLK